jgi:hypothetical protein
MDELVVTPQLYLAHAHEDREMARPLAEKMMAQGIEVWFDQWEIKIGDRACATASVSQTRWGAIQLIMAADPDVPYQAAAIAMLGVYSRTGFGRQSSAICTKVYHDATDRK